MKRLVVRSHDQRVLYAGLVADRASDAPPRAVLDPTWPAAVLDRAAADVEVAGVTGRLGRGDLVLFSSGSTGRPRGIVRTAASWAASVPGLTEITGLSAQDVVWLPGPLWSSLFLYGAYHACATDAGVRLAGEDPGDATAAHLVPTQLPGVLDRVVSGSLPSLRLVVVAGDRLPPALRRRASLLGLRVVEYYGAAELSFVAWTDAPGPLRPFPGVDLAVRDGEVWARSAYLARGYLTDDPGPLRREGDWATVGDLARRTGPGIEVLGRGSAAVTVGGHTVVVEEVEQVLRHVAGVSDAAVVGLPNPRLGAQLVAVVVGDACEDVLRAAVAGLPAPSRPRRFVRVDALPRTSAGKLRRLELAQRLQGPA